MRYLHTNDDGSVAIWGCVPTKVASKKGSGFFIVLGVSRTATECLLQGRGFLGLGNTIVVGDQDFDVADLEVDSLPGYTIEFPDFELNIKAKLAKPDKERVTGHRVCSKAEVPTDRAFRAAWRDGGKSIDVDMGHAKEITRDRLRKERAPLLADLDVQAIRAVEAEDKAKLAEVAAEKQRLRDITALEAIDTAKTPEDLTAISVAASSAALISRRL